MQEDAEGAARARSASEAFLYRRLDTLAETTGRFRLNVALPIPFDGFGTLEVDLLCADARVAIELDGGQHLADPIAYRRDNLSHRGQRVAMFTPAPQVPTVPEPYGARVGLPWVP
jgi:very-short-patch-repair endonuclease